MGKPVPLDPSTQFICDDCGRTFNFGMREEYKGKEVCEDCYLDEVNPRKVTDDKNDPLAGQRDPKGPQPTSFEARMVKAAQVALDKAKAKLKEAIDAEKAAREKKSPVLVQGGEEEVTEESSDEGDEAQTQ